MPTDVRFNRRMAPSSDPHDQRKSRRMPVKCRVHYDIGGISLKGITVNASKGGLLIKSALTLETAFEIFGFLSRKPNHRTSLELALEDDTYITEAEVRHYHLDSSDDDRCILRVGFRLPKDALRMRLRR